jgi:hypothetical protein
MRLRRTNRDQQTEPHLPAPAAPDSRPLISLRALVLFTIATAAALLIATHPAIGLPIVGGATILGLLHKITEH